MIGLETGFYKSGVVFLHGLQNIFNRLTNQTLLPKERDINNKSYFKRIMRNNTYFHVPEKLDKFRQIFKLIFNVRLYL